MTLRIFFAGEGPDELGQWASERAYFPKRDDADAGGVLHALVSRFSRYETGGAERWKNIRKFRAGDHAKPEERTISGLALRAVESRCDALVFVRDRDRDLQREEDVENGIARAANDHGIAIVGGTANEELEAWILAMLGTSRAESLADPKKKLQEAHGIGTREEMCAVVERTDMNALPADCASLRRWLGRAQQELGAARTSE